MKEHLKRPKPPSKYYKEVERMVAQKLMGYTTRGLDRMGVDVIDKSGRFYQVKHGVALKISEALDYLSRGISVVHIFKGSKMGVLLEVADEQTKPCGDMRGTVTAGDVGGLVNNIYFNKHKGIIFAIKPFSI